MRPCVLSLSLVCTIAAGCGEEAPPPAPARPAVAPQIEAPPPPPPPAPPTGRALLVATEWGLSPIACFLDQTKSFAEGESCLALAPVGSEVWLMSGQAAKVTGTGAATCPGAATPEPTLVVDAPRELLRGDAVAPASLQESLSYVAPTRPDEVDRGAPAELRQRLARVIAAKYPELARTKLRVDQRAALDLDGDGAGEELVAVSIPAATKGDDDAPARLSALFLAPAAGEPVLLRGRTDTRERYTVLGAIDLDGEAPRELYLNTYDDEGFSLSLEQQGPEGLRTRGRWACGV